jgi:hypothetical protein
MNAMKKSAPAANETRNAKMMIVAMNVWLLIAIR